MCFHIPMSGFSLREKLEQQVTSSAGKTRPLPGESTFIHSLTHPFIHSFIHLLIHSLVQFIKDPP